MADGQDHTPAQATADDDAGSGPTQVQLMKAAEELSLASLAGRSRLARRAGLQFGGDRDIFKAAGYVPVGDLDFDHYWGLYKRGDVAGRIVDMPAQTSWRRPPEISEPGKKEGQSEFVSAWETLRTRLRLTNRMERVDRLAGIGRYAVLFIGVRGVEDDKQLQEPVEGDLGPEDILFTSVYHEGAAKINTWVTDQNDPRFGLPETYKIDLTGDLPGFDSGTGKMIVHHTRVIHVAEDVLSDDVFGRPRLERCFNRLFDLEKILASTGESYWQLASRVLIGSIPEDAEIDDDDLDDLGEALEEIVHDLRRQLLGQNIKLDWLSSDPPDPSDTADLYLFIIAAAAGIPKRILFGTETGERASTQDERQWLGTIEERIQRFVEPVILRAFIDRMIMWGVLPSPEKEYEVLWPNLYRTTPEENAESDKTVSETAKNLTPVGGDPRDLIVIEEDGHARLRPSAEWGTTGDETDESLLPPDPEGPPEADAEE